MKHVYYINACDWAAIYIDGELYHQDHSLRLYNLPQNEKIVLTELKPKDESKVEGYLENYGSFPLKLADLLPLLQ